MKKRAAMERSTILLVSASLVVLLFVSSVCVLLTEEVLSSVWQKLGSSATSMRNAGVYVGNRMQGFPRGDAWVTQHHDPTCLSRTQQYLYRKPAYISPIPAPFLEAWASYTQMFKSCSHHNWTELFLKRDHSSSQHDNGCQYLIYIEGREGLGNGLLSLASAFVFAMATGRMLLIDNRKNIATLLCEPFSESSWVLPPDFPYAELLNSSSIGPFSRNNLRTNSVCLNLEHTIGSSDQRFFCEEVYSSLKTVKWVAWSSNQYFLTNLFLIPSFWQHMHPIFKESVGHIFTFISRLLFLPANDTWAIIMREYWSYLSGASTQLGVQVRLHGRHNLAEFDPVANDKIMECLVQNGLLPSFSEGENITELSTLHGRKMQARENSADIAVLLASLQGKYAEKMEEQFRKVPTKGTKMVRVHSVSHQGSENRRFQQAQLAFVEMWLLSFSDNLATSEFSTFGYVAQGLGDLHPYILGLKNGDHNSPCVLGQSVEPCTHYPKTPGACLGANANLSMEHKQWIRTHLRHCQDHEKGWQLVPGGAAQGNPVSFDFL